MIFQVPKKHTPTLNRIIQSLDFNPGTTHKNLENKPLISVSDPDPDPDPVGSVSFGRIRIRIRIRKR